jgi:hypothetical protein
MEILTKVSSSDFGTPSTEGEYPYLLAFSR